MYTVVVYGGVYSGGMVTSTHGTEADVREGWGGASVATELGQDT